MDEHVSRLKPVLIILRADHSLICPRSSSMSSGDERPDRADESMLLDAKEVRLKGCKVSFFIPARAMSTRHDGSEFVKMTPNRYRNISKLITSRCTGEQKKRISKAGQSFWTNKRSPGKMFLNKLAKYRSRAIKKAFKVGKNRLSSRRKQHRSEQLRADFVDVELPACGGNGSIVTSMPVGKPRSALTSVALNVVVLEHIAVMASKFFGKVGIEEDDEQECTIDSEFDNAEDPDDDNAEPYDADNAEDCDDHAETDDSNMNEGAPDMRTISDHYENSQLCGRGEVQETNPSQTPNIDRVSSPSPVLLALLRGAKK